MAFILGLHIQINIWKGNNPLKFYFLRVKEPKKHTIQVKYHSLILLHGKQKLWHSENSYDFNKGLEHHMGESYFVIILFVKG